VIVRFATNPFAVVAGIMYSPETAKNVVGEGWRWERRNTSEGIVRSLPQSATGSALRIIAQATTTTTAASKNHIAQQKVSLRDHSGIGRTRIEVVVSTGAGSSVSGATT